MMQRFYKMIRTCIKEIQHLCRLQLLETLTRLFLNIGPQSINRPLFWACAPIKYSASFFHFSAWSLCCRPQTGQGDLWFGDLIRQGQHLELRVKQHIKVSYEENTQNLHVYLNRNAA